MATENSFVSNFTQIAWVVKDITVALKFFKEGMGIGNFSNPEIIRLNEFQGTYYGNPCDGESLVSIAYSGGTFIELIQPLFPDTVYFRTILIKILQAVCTILHTAYRLKILIKQFQKWLTEVSP